MKRVKGNVLFNDASGRHGKGTRDRERERQGEEGRKFRAFLI